MNKNRVVSISFTAHRPKNNNMGGYDLNSTKNIKIKEKVKDKIKWCITIFRCVNIIFYIGGALGGDQLCFRAVEEIKEEYPNINIKIILCMPFKNQDNNWINSGKEELSREKNVSDKVILVDLIDKYKIKGYKENEYYPAKMQRRNIYMIDNSSILIAIFDGSNGGTYNAVNYAELQKRFIIIINPSKI